MDAGEAQLSTEAAARLTYKQVRLNRFNLYHISVLIYIIIVIQPNEYRVNINDS